MLEVFTRMNVLYGEKYRQKSEKAIKDGNVCDCKSMPHFQIFYYLFCILKSYFFINSFMILKVDM